MYASLCLVPRAADPFRDSMGQEGTSSPEKVERPQITPVSMTHLLYCLLEKGGSEG